MGRARPMARRRPMALTTPMARTMLLARTMAADTDDADDDNAAARTDEDNAEDGRDWRRGPNAKLMARTRRLREPERHPILLLPRKAPKRARCRLALVPRRGGVARIGLGLRFGGGLLSLNAGAEGGEDAGGRERGFCFSMGRAGGGGDQADVAGAGGGEDAGGRGCGFGTDRGSGGRGGGCDVCDSAQRRGTGKGAGAAGAEAGGDLVLIELVQVAPRSNTRQHLSDVDSGHPGHAGSPERLRKLCAGIDEDGGGGEVRGTDDGAKRRGAGAGADAARAEARRGLACVELLQTSNVREHGCSDNGNGGNGRGGGFTHDGATASSDTSNSNNGLRSLLNSNDGLDVLNIDDARLPLRDLVRNVQSEEVQSRENDDGQHKHDKPDRRRREGGRGGRGSGEGRHCVVGADCRRRKSTDLNSLRGALFIPHRFLSPMQSPSQSPR
ncbi:hypothetical protein C8R47DRAFT_1162618 [Mycena vitilis]|nr:hypothetical protein C8R47DRAFT_1162618 [Mycena vitilis]